MGAVDVKLTDIWYNNDNDHDDNQSMIIMFIMTIGPIHLSEQMATSVKELAQIAAGWTMLKTPSPSKAPLASLGLSSSWLYSQRFLAI